MAVQDEVAAGVVRALQVEVVSLPARVRPRNSEAYEHYLRGLHYWDRFDEQGFNEAVAEFQHALDVDPSFAPAAGRLAMAFYGLANWGFVPPNKGYEEMRAAALAGLALDPNEVDARVALGLVHLEYDWDWVAAGQEFAKAKSISPNDPNTLTALAQEQMALGQWADAMRSIDAAIAADPLDASSQEIRSWVYLRAGRLAEAENAARRALEISPTYATGRYELALALLSERKNEAALLELQKETEPESRDVGLVMAYTALNRPSDARAALARLKEKSHWSMGFVYAYSALTQIDLAFESLDRAYAEKDIDLCYLKRHPGLSNLEGDPRYKAFLRKMNLPE